MRPLFVSTGQPLDEIVSAVQKTIRRGDEKAAMKCALAMIPQFEKYLWRRLMVIAMEDVGLAAPEVIVQVKTLRDLWFELRETDRSGDSMLCLANAILIMCRAPKSRITDNFQAVCRKELEDAKTAEIPDYALDSKTARGRAMGRTIEFHIKEGCKIDAALPDPYKEAAEASWIAGWRGTLPGCKRRTPGTDEEFNPQNGQVPLF